MLVGKKKINRFDDRISSASTRARFVLPNRKKRALFLVFFLLIFVVCRLYSSFSTFCGEPSSLMYMESYYYR